LTQPSGSPTRSVSAQLPPRRRLNESYGVEGEQRALDATASLGCGGRKAHRRFRVQRHDPQLEPRIVGDAEGVEPDGPRRTVPETVGDDFAVGFELRDVTGPLDLEEATPAPLSRKRAAPSPTGP
jgi:hypothetical protein